MAQPQPFLQLTEDFGGEFFGPIDQAEYRLGTAEDNEVRLTEGLGVEPHHARIVRKSGDTYYLSPVERGATVWLFRGDRGAPEALTGPAVVRPGDAFALGTPQGIRFRLVIREPAKPAVAKGSAAEDRAAQLQSGLAQEAQRRAMSTFVRTVPGRMASAAKQFIKNRTFLSPVWILGFGLAMSGWTVGAWKCTSNVATTAQLESSQISLQDCKTELDICRTGGVPETGKVDLPELVAKAAKDPTWARSLGWPEMSDATKSELERIFGAPEKLFSGWYLGARNPYRDVSERLIKQGGMPDNLARLIAWTAVDPYLAPPEGVPTSAVWSLLAAPDPTTSACQRGAMRLTYRQAVGLGLTTREDALLANGAGGALAGSDQTAVLNKVGQDFNVTRAGAGQSPRGFTPDDVPILHALVNNTDLCFGVAGTDERDDMGAVIRKLGAGLGTKGSGLPEEGADNWLSARVAKLYALHLKGGASASLDLDQRTLGPAFASVQTSDPAGVALVADRAGRTVARAIAIPCVLVLEGGDAFPDYLGAPPDFDACALLAARAAYRRW